MPRTFLPGNGSEVKRPACTLIQIVIENTRAESVFVGTNFW